MEKQATEIAHTETSVPADVNQINILADSINIVDNPNGYPQTELPQSL